MNGLVATMLLLLAAQGDSAPRLPDGVAGDWLLVAVPGPQDPRLPVTVVFREPASASWSDGCNTRTVAFDVQGASFRLGERSDTLLECMPSRPALVVPFPAEGRFERVAGELHVLGATGTLRFQRVRQAP